MAKARKTAASKAAKPRSRPGPAARSAKARPAKAKAKPAKAKARPAPARRPRISDPRIAKRAAKKPAAPPPIPAPHAPISTGGAMIRILDEASPRDALATMLGGIATVQEGQIALGAAQLMLSSVDRGGPAAYDIVDLVVSHWERFPDRSGFHAQEFLRNAFAAVGADRERIGHLAKLVPVDASPELRFNMACAYALAGDRLAMLREVEAALAAGVAPPQFARERDFAAYADDPRLRVILELGSAPAIPVDVEPHVGTVRAALDAVVATLRELGESATLAPPASLEAVIEAERAGALHLPNDYRALLTLCDGMTLWNHRFLGTLDLRGDTELAARAREYLEMSADHGATGIDGCIALASWGQPDDWLLYDPRGAFRDGEPGYVLMLNADELLLDSLAHALERFERIARDVLGTN